MNFKEIARKLWKYCDLCDGDGVIDGPWIATCNRCNGKASYPPTHDQVAAALEEAALNGARAMFEEPEHGHYTSENDGIWTFHPIKQPFYHWLNNQPPGGPKELAEFQFREWLKTIVNK